MATAPTRQDNGDLWRERKLAENCGPVPAALGPWPGRDIRYAPFDKVLRYACRDADATLRLWLREQQMTRRIRKTTQERWGDSV